VFNLAGVSQAQLPYVNDAILRCTFPFSRMRPLLGIFTGSDTIAVRTTGNLGYMGLTSYDPPLVELDAGLNPEDIGVTLLHEVAHHVDAWYLSNNQREALIDVFFGSRSPDNANLARLRERGWFAERGSEYWDQFGEAFAEAFVSAFSDYPVETSRYTYKAGPLERRRVRDVIFGISGGWGTL
jgi:hypothetical protein